MNTTKIAVIVKRNFSEFYDIKCYRKASSDRITLRQYQIDRLIAVKEK